MEDSIGVDISPVCNSQTDTSAREVDYQREYVDLAGNEHFASAIRPYRCENSFPRYHGADTTTLHHPRSLPIRSATVARPRDHKLPPHIPLRAFSDHDHDEPGPAPRRATNDLEAPAPVNKKFDQQSSHMQN
jgi:hypothetical protein